MELVKEEEIGEKEGLVNPEICDLDEVTDYVRKRFLKNWWAMAKNRELKRKVLKEADARAHDIGSVGESLEMEI